MKLKLLLIVCMVIMSIFFVQANSTSVYSNTTQVVTGVYSNTTQMTCVPEGESLGAVVPGNNAVCCAGLVAVVPTGIVGTRGTCMKPVEICPSGCICEGKVMTCPFEHELSNVSEVSTGGNISIVPIGYQDCSMLKCPNAYYNKELQQCACGRNSPLTGEKDSFEVINSSVVDTNCSMLKCKNAYYDKELQQCACGQNSPLTNEKDSSEVIISGVKIANKFVISTSGASGNDCKEYLSGCDAGELVLCDKWNVNCQDKETVIITTEDLTLENNSLYVNQKEIIMPDQASQTAIDQLSLKKNVSIELKDNSKVISSKTNHKPIYEVTGTKNAKIFALFSTKMQIKTSIDAQTGVIEKTEKPWWSFLAKE